MGRVSNLTGCCDNQNKLLYGFFDGSFSNNGDCKTAIDLSSVALDLCDISKGTAVLKPNETKIITADFLSLISKDNFFLKCGLDSKTLNFVLDFLEETETVGSILTSIISGTISIDVNEIIFNWINFGNLPLNDSDHWENISHNWSFYSTISSTTSYTPFTTLDYEGTMERLDGDESTLFIDFTFEDKKKMKLEFHSDENNVITFVGVTFSHGILCDIYVNETDTNEFSVTLREVLLFKEIYQIFFISSLDTSSYLILNENSEDLFLDFMTASKCSETDASPCCC